MDYAAVVDETAVTSLSSNSSSSSTWLANSLGYLVGFGSFMLYTPIAVRLYRQKSAEGTTLVTWMMKLSSYTCTDLYSLWKHYPISTYIETLIITVQAALILSLVSIYQQRLRDPTLWTFVMVYITLAAYLYLEAPPEVLAAGQLLAAALNSGALIPQFVLNIRNRTKGDYSPVTAGLAATGCAIRLYTIQQLADNDPILLLSFGLAFVLNTSLLLQIMYYGVMVEGLSLGAVLSSDLVRSSTSISDSSSSHSTTVYSLVAETAAAGEGDSSLFSRPTLSRFAVMMMEPLVEGAEEDVDHPQQQQQQQQQQEEEFIIIPSSSPSSISATACGGSTSTTRHRPT